jgi:arabinofuranan 3-O-arabinosyltransferase
MGSTTRLRITVVDVSQLGGATLGIAEIQGLGLDTQRTLTSTDALVGSAGGALVLRARPGNRSPCVARQPSNCLPSLQRSGEEDSGIDRTVTTAGIDGPLAVQALPRPGEALDRLLLPVGGARAQASSQLVTDPVVRAQAAIDRDPWTAWIAAPGDDSPTLTIRLPRRATISWLRVLETLDLAASRPLTVDVRVGGRTYPVTSDDDGFLRFPATRTSRITLTVRSTVPLLTFDTALQTRSVLPVGISELQLGEADGQRLGVDRRAVVALPCGFAPTVQAGRVRALTEIRTTVGEVLDGAPAVARACGTRALPSGTVRIQVRPSGEFRPVAVTWSDSRTAVVEAQTPRILDWTATERSLQLSASQRVRTLELSENANAGWVATIEGAELAPVRVDGWRQAWVVPAGVAGVVELTFAPDRAYRLLLLVGALAALLLLLLALLPGRTTWPPRTRRAPASARTRYSSVLALAVLTLGASGVAGAGGAILLARRGARRAWVAAGGVAVATSGAVVAPWPQATTWPSWASVVAALSVSAGTGLVIGSLVTDAGDVVDRTPVDVTTEAEPAAVADDL